MAHVVRRRSGTWEVREAHATPRGPRSRTLASFRELTPALAQGAAARASVPVTAEDVWAAARRSGAPVAGAGTAGARLLAALRHGAPPASGLRRVLLDGLGAHLHDPVTANERAAAEWLDASPERRGDTLRELLLLADRLPRRAGGRGPRFPPIRGGT